MQISSEASIHQHYVDGLEILLSRDELAILVRDNVLVIDSLKMLQEKDAEGKEVVSHKHQMIRVLIVPTKVKP